MKKALFPGTFDPPTLGHLDLIKRAEPICDKLYVGIAVNTSKSNKPFFPTEEKISMLKEICKDFSYVEIVSFSGLVVDFAKKHGIDFILRGLRAYSDFEYEFRMALANRKIGNIETVFLMPDERQGHISSTLIRELALYKTRLHDFVPAAIEERVFSRLTKN
ncbi:MAG TPA: pantetheine-phosphate adenylyltransferase [Rhabdochlamydiaceae bacterium]|nr:pantetheine-phosphate adenylyltransferase [Rhabdochlamydiaceae bacterium]